MSSAGGTKSKTVEKIKTATESAVGPADLQWIGFKNRLGYGHGSKLGSWVWVGAI